MCHRHYPRTAPVGDWAATPTSACPASCPTAQPELFRPVLRQTSTQAEMQQRTTGPRTSPSGYQSAVRQYVVSSCLRRHPPGSRLTAQPELFRPVLHRASAQVKLHKRPAPKHRRLGLPHSTVRVFWPVLHRTSTQVQPASGTAASTGPIESFLHGNDCSTSSSTTHAP
jgi:hypothetical protein